MTDKRFHGKAGDDYEIFRLTAFPITVKLHNIISEKIRHEFSLHSMNIINVLEIGCGTGYTTKTILNSDTRTKIVAIDNEEKMIDQIKETLDTYIKSGKVTLIENDALDFLKTQNLESFDIIVTAATLHNFTQDYRKNILTEVYRVLKPNCLFINADKYALNDPVEHNKTLNWQLKELKRVFTKSNRIDLLEEWTNHYLIDNKPELIMKEKESINFMKEIGFKDVELVFREQMDAVLIARK